MNKKGVIKVLKGIANILELKKENPFKVRAYRNAANSLIFMQEDLETVIDEGRLTEYSGIGKQIGSIIYSLSKKGKHPFYERLKKSTPSFLLKLLLVYEIDPKKIRRLYQRLKISSLEDLKKAARQGKIAKIKGIGQSTEKNILHALTHKELYVQRHNWWAAYNKARDLLNEISGQKGVIQARIVGSLRRKLETVGDLNFLVSSDEPTFIIHWFAHHPFVDRILIKKKNQVKVHYHDGYFATLQIVKPKNFSFFLFYTTGNSEHVEKIKKLANKKKALFTKNEESEREIYKKVGLHFIVPELRENRGEIETKKLPKLIEIEDIKGSFHNHTQYSDGRHSIVDMVRQAEKLGWEYIGISDHSKSCRIAHGMMEETLYKQIKEIREINCSKKLKIHIFSGLECDILANGELDYPDTVLQNLDFVIASVHSAFSQDSKTLTKRLIKAVEHPLTTMIGHLTGRILLHREPYGVNVEKIIDACIDNGKALEINGYPSRMDLDWRYWHKASDKGLKCCINADAHAKDQLRFIELGIFMARKGWLEKKDVINTLSLQEMKNFLKKGR